MYPLEQEKRWKLRTLARDGLAAEYCRFAAGACGGGRRGCSTDCGSGTLFGTNTPPELSAIFEYGITMTGDGAMIQGLMFHKEKTGTNVYLADDPLSSASLGVLARRWTILHVARQGVVYVRHGSARAGIAAGGKRRKTLFWGGYTMLDSKQIQEIIPHRYPFLLVDKIRNG